ncbi:hypothetical protein [Brachybacterium sp. 107]|uniref:hypothetical protein n=1 Tax=Brachybacterium sp. 107 TaxID=3457736 RepID=UPI0040335E2E
MIAVLVVAVLVLIFCVTPHHDNTNEQSRKSPQPEASTSVTRASSMELPAESEVVSFDFEVPERGQTLLELSVGATFTASTGEKRALYAIVGMSCGSIDGPTNTQSVSGTENLIHQTTRQLTQLLSYDVETSGRHRCNASINAPNWDHEYGDAKLSLEATIRVITPDDEPYQLVTADSEHPVVLDPGETVSAVEGSFPLITGSTGDLGVASTTHLTSCTISNGSRDQTQANLCTEPKVNREGSQVSTRTTVQQLNGDEVCRTVTADRSLTAIDHLVHHRLLSSQSRTQGFLSNPCGNRLRVVHEISNDGPAALVVHRSTTNAAIITY